MLWILVSIGCGLLAIIVLFACALRMLRRLCNLAGAVNRLLLDNTATQPASRAVPADVVEVLRLQNDAWVHHNWVRDGTPACQLALDTPGLALRRTRNEMDLGRQ